jgi:hypothetical protein
VKQRVSWRYKKARIGAVAPKGEKRYRKCNTRATSYVTADNPGPMAYLILKVIYNPSKNNIYFIPKIKLHIA